MKPKFVVILDQCIETGLNVGWERAHKHTETPTKDELLVKIEVAIWNEIHEFFDVELYDE